MKEVVSSNSAAMKQEPVAAASTRATRSKRAAEAGDDEAESIEMSSQQVS